MNEMKSYYIVWNEEEEMFSVCEGQSPSIVGKVFL